MHASGIHLHSFKPMNHEARIMKKKVIKKLHTATAPLLDDCQA